MCLIENFNKSNVLNKIMYYAKLGIRKIKHTSFINNSMQRVSSKIKF